ncbi:MAG: penicillin-binding protein [Ruminococcaceae bacterium]|nr:penicillin-binding protein [Oscillospiraceae bacterium]
MENQKYFKRFAIITAFVLIILLVYDIILMKMQLENGETYRTQAIQRTATSVTITAARGEIVDRYGRSIAENRMGYNIVFNRAEMEKGSENEIIWQLTKILSKSGEQWIDACPITIDAAGLASYMPDSDLEKSRMWNTLKLQKYATAQNCIDTMYTEFELGNLDAATARRIMGVRLNMEIMEFSSANPYTFAEDVSLETMQTILENSAILKGVTVEVVPIRIYTNGEIAPHLIGNTGPIYAEEYMVLKTQGYRINDTIGKFGIESEYESYLRGKNGKKQILRDDNGEIVYENISVEPKPGNTIVLTIDSELQLLAQKSLETTIKSIAARGGFLTGGDANAGAVVIMNVKTFEVLAAVTYPSFDLNTYNKEYNNLLKQDGSPLYNRAFNGNYAPGSTFKPAVALAGLQEGEISRYTTIYCSGRYTLTEYNNFSLTCLHVHGTLSVEGAISESCNIFFYETGYRLGITRMNDYCRQLGLGVATGVGLGESSGRLAGREDRESREENWYAADTLTAAIGQNDNKFTPLQLCAYMATIANGGTRYQARIIKTIKSYDMTETIIEDTCEDPIVLNELNVEKSIINIVKNGMLSVTQEGTASAVFENYIVKVGGKTGSVDTDKKRYSSNGLFIAFAPFDDPEIAIAIIGEKVQYGSYMTQVARDILDEYFFSTKTNGYSIVTENQLVG